MKIKTADLAGSALDWAVEKALGTFWSANGYFVFKNPERFVFKNPEFAYSTDREHGGEIIERECIDTGRGNDVVFPKGNEKGVLREPLWLASKRRGRVFHGRTRLEAGLRCYVASNLGDEVDVPEELLR